MGLRGVDLENLATSELAASRPSGRLAASGASIGSSGATSEKRHASHGQGGGHVTPSGMLYSNLRLLYSNLNEISNIHPETAKYKVFTGLRR